MYLRKVGKEITGEFTAVQAKSPEDIALEFYYGTFWEAVKTAKFYGELAGCRDVLQARIEFPTVRDMQRGTWLAEGAVFYPDEKVVLVSPQYNPLFYDLKETEKYFSRLRGLPLEKTIAQKITDLAEDDLFLPSVKKNALILPWKCYPRSSLAGVTFNKVAEDELTAFLFRDMAKEYGFRNSLVHTDVQGFCFEFRPCEETPSSYSEPFALPLFLSKISNGSHIEVYEKNDAFRNWNFAINQRKGMYGIPNAAKETRLRQFGRTLSNHGIEDPQALDKILSKHFQE